MSADALELDCEKSVLEAAQIAGWRRHGERAARTKKGWVTPVKGEPGWPDLVLVKGPMMVAAELKRPGNKPTPDQVAWLEAFDRLPGCIALVLWVPVQMDEFNNRLFARRFWWAPLAQTLEKP